MESTMNTSTTNASTTKQAATAAAEDPQSRAEVDVSDKAAVERWAKALGTTDEALINAVQNVGRRIDKIKEFLGAGGMAGKVSGG
jgi:ribosomal protein S11